ncbi:MAG: hypothetical protein HC923_01150 [Myxococcales bacterium]|nr:hypothetical protein [Myxococcales bacterium]
MSIYGNRRDLDPPPGRKLAVEIMASAPCACGNPNCWSAVPSCALKLGEAVGHDGYGELGSRPWPEPSCLIVGRDGALTEVKVRRPRMVKLKDAPVLIAWSIASACFFFRPVVQLVAELRRALGEAGREAADLLFRVVDLFVAAFEDPAVREVRRCAERPQVWQEIADQVTEAAKRREHAKLLDNIAWDKAVGELESKLAEREPFPTPLFGADQ